MPWVNDPASTGFTGSNERAAPTDQPVDLAALSVAELAERLVRQYETIMRHPDYVMCGPVSLAANRSLWELTQELQRRRWNTRIRQDSIEVYRSNFLLITRYGQGRPAEMRCTPYHLMNRIFWYLRGAEELAIRLGDEAMAKHYRAGLALLLRRWQIYQINSRGEQIEFRVEPGYGGVYE